MTKVTIDRELLERANSLLCSYSSTLTDRAVTRRAISEICGILAAPRQPEGEAASILLPALRQYMHNDGSGLLAGYEYERTQQIVAELLAERDTLRQQLAERDAAIEEWSGTAVQNGMECDRLAAQRDKMAHLCKCASGYDISSALRTQIDAALAEVGK